MVRRTYSFGHYQLSPLTKGGLYHARQFNCNYGTAKGPVEKEKESSVGDGLLSHTTDRILPWALAGLTAGFEMGPGGPPPLLSPTELSF